MRFFSTALGFAAAMAAMPAAAQDAPASSTPEQPTEQQIKDAGATFTLILNTMASDNAPEGVKNALFQCLYFGSIGEISAAATEVIARNPQLQEMEPGQARAEAISAICRIPASDAPAAPAPSGAEPQTR